MEFNALHDSENISPPAEPHLGSFVPEVTVQESPVEQVFEDIDPEEQKDRTLSIVFLLIGTLTLLSGIGYFVKNNVTPTRTSIVSELYVNDSDIQNTIQQDTAQLGATQTSSSDIESGVQPTAETFANTDVGAGANPNIKTNPNPTKKPVEYIITETVTRATSSSASTPLNRTQSLTEQAFSTKLGISFVKDPFWNMTEDENSVTLKKVGPTTRDIIVIKRFKGNVVTTKDAVYGDVTYFYNASSSSWMRIRLENGTKAKDTSIEQDIQPEAYTPTRFTKYNKPIFEGTSRYKTLIVAFGAEDFLIVNIGGSGYTKILDSFVEQIEGRE